MKPGDKVWQIGDTAWYLDRNSMRIKSAIVTDVFVYGTKGKFCLLSQRQTPTKIILSCRFPHPRSAVRTLQEDI